MMTPWIMLDPRMTPEHLGFIPSFLDVNDPRPAKEQFNERYVAGWSSFKGHTFNPEDCSLSYPGDPPLKPLAATNLRDEMILVYDYAWVAIVQPDKSVEVCRMD